MKTRLHPFTFNTYRHFFVLFIVFIGLLFHEINAQKIDPNHQLLWEISGNGVKTPSYLYGTMHLRDSRVFNLPDSVYSSIESCKHFALEVHPDTMVKHLIVNPFNENINQRFEEEFSEKFEQNDDIIIEELIEEKSGLKSDLFNTDDPLILDLILKNVFKKGKEKKHFSRCPPLSSCSFIGKKYCWIRKQSRIIKKHYSLYINKKQN